MNTQQNETEWRELSDDELDFVSGGISYTGKEVFPICACGHHFNSDDRMTEATFEGGIAAFGKSNRLKCPVCGATGYEVTIDE